MERPLCFLDFDGVLNSNQYFVLNPGARGNENIDPKAVRLFDGFLELTGAHVVIASSWREGRSVEELSEILGQRGLSRTHRIIGKTPVLNASRGDEIVAYLRRKAWGGVGRGAQAIVIFDDDPDTGSLRRYHVQTDPRRGLTGKDVQRGISILKAQAK